MDEEQDFQWKELAKQWREIHQAWEDIKQERIDIEIEKEALRMLFRKSEEETGCTV